MSHAVSCLSCRGNLSSISARDKIYIFCFCFAFFSRDDCVESHRREFTIKYSFTSQLPANFMAMNILSVVRKVTSGTKFLKLCTRFKIYYDCVKKKKKKQERKLKTSENRKQEILYLPNHRRSA